MFFPFWNVPRLRNLPLGSRCQSANLFSNPFLRVNVPFGHCHPAGERCSHRRRLVPPGKQSSAPQQRGVQRPLSGVPGSPACAQGRGCAGSAEPRLLPVACPPLGWGCGGEREGARRGEGEKEAPAANLRGEVGGWVAVGQLKKSRRGVPPNLSGLRARGGQERSGAGSAHGTRIASPSRAATRASSRGTRRPPTQLLLVPGGRDRTLPHAAPCRQGETPQPCRPPPLEGQTFPIPDPNPWYKLVARRLRREPSTSSAHFCSEMSERKEGRGKGKGRKKDRGSGKKPEPAEGDSRPALPPRLKEMKSQESAAGSKLVLRCETSSEYSALKFKWFKNGNELNRKNKPQNIKIQKKPGKSELRINKASLADSGEYMCKVISKLGNDSATASITIVDSNEVITGMPASTERAYVSSESPIRISVSTEGANTSSLPWTTYQKGNTSEGQTTSTSTTGTSHLVKCAEKEKTFCVNGGECFMVKDLSNPSRFLCKCPNEFTGDRCQNYVMASFYKAEELYQKRVLTISGICIALLVVGIMCVVAYCKTKKQRKKLHDRLRQSLRSERNNMVNIANGPHHPNPPPENVQLVNQYVSKNVISSEHIVEREAETSFSTSHYTSTTHHSTTVTQTPSHSWSNGHTESILSESHSVIVMSSVENSRHSSPSGGPRGRLNGLGGPRECNSFLRHARETPDSYRDSPHSERYVSAMTTPARMSPVDFHTPSSPKSPPSEMSPPVSSMTVSMPSMAVSPFVEEERPLLLVTPPKLREKKYDHHPQQFSNFHHNPAHESNSLPASPLRIVEDEEYETTQEYEPAQEPVKKLANSRRAKRTKPNGHIANRLELDSNTSSENSNSESETEDERVGEDTPFLGIQNPLAASLEVAPAFRLTDSRTNPAGRFSTQEELQARLSSVIANQDPIAV
ncbi:pro-neuregulin-1, membrane-bound isoform isoform X3 [Octodon degus]|uniref:Pro-neuregulin-1, membrane-bound isoform n=1 Tax=Octodon degus TaxID=10160 RepID=A0A6P6F0N5_OCTDE|nr:pro-neuregulin-1, membrane-bound isoform isoform X3 [Octodon degus]